MQIEYVVVKWPKTVCQIRLFQKVQYGFKERRDLPRERLYVGQLTKKIFYNRP